MKTYIFFDTNVLEIPDRKDYSLFQFSSNYRQAVKLIEKYNLVEKVALLVPCIVTDELLEHYKSDYKSKVQSGIEEIKKLNDNLKGVVEKEFVLKPVHEVDEYIHYIEKSKNEYLEKWSIETVGYPNELIPIVERAVNKHKPFATAHKGGKKYSDAGFKDVVIWESIKNYQLDEDDVIFLFTEDNDFYNPSLADELSNEFVALGTIDSLLEKLLVIYDIDKEIFEYKEYIKTDYFNEKVADNLNRNFRQSWKLYKFQSVDLDIENAVVERDEYDFIQIMLPARIYYLDDNMRKMSLQIVLTPTMVSKEFEAFEMEGFDLKDGLLIAEKDGELNE